MGTIHLEPLVSICIPAHNAQKYLPATLKALAAQDYLRIEIIVVDDHSTDKTKSIIEDFPGTVIILIAAERRGAAAARNIAFKHSKGELIIFFDSDDLVEPNFISQQVKFWKSATPDSLIVSRWGRFYTENAADFKLEDEQSDLRMNLRDWVVNYWTNISQMTIPARVLIPRNIIIQAGGWNEELSLNDDFEFYTRLFSHAEQLLINPDAVVKYRSGINGLSQQKQSKEKQIAQFQSIILATTIVLQKYQDPAVKLACANILQAYVYECYPMLPKLTAKAQLIIDELGGSNLPFIAGGLTKLLKNILGWRQTKRIKYLLGF